MTDATENEPGFGFENPVPLNPCLRLVHIIVSSPAREMVGLKILLQGPDLQTLFALK